MINYTTRADLSPLTPASLETTLSSDGHLYLNGIINSFKYDTIDQRLIIVAKDNYKIPAIPLKVISPEIPIDYSKVAWTIEKISEKNGLDLDYTIRSGTLFIDGSFDGVIKVSAVYLNDPNIFGVKLINLSCGEKVDYIYSYEDLIQSDYSVKSTTTSIEVSFIGKIEILHSSGKVDLVSKRKETFIVKFDKNMENKEVKRSGKISWGTIEIPWEVLQGTSGNGNIELDEVPGEGYDVEEIPGEYPDFDEILGK